MIAKIFHLFSSDSKGLASVNYVKAASAVKHTQPRKGIPCYCCHPLHSTQRHSDILLCLPAEHLLFYLFPHRNVSLASQNYKTNRRWWLSRGVMESFIAQAIPRTITILYYTILYSTSYTITTTKSTNQKVAFNRMDSWNSF